MIGQYGYFGIALLLILGGLGLPMPEEAPIILAAVLSRNGKMQWMIAFAACLIGVLVGDFIVYFLGYFYGEKVLQFPLTRKFLTKARETQIKGYFHRHGFKILILGRFAFGFRTAAYLTAGILQLPVLKLFLTDLLAASLSTSLMFGLGYIFAHQIEVALSAAQRWVTVIIAAAIGIWLLHRYLQARRRAGQLVGPPVLEEEALSVPPETLLQPAPAPEPTPEPAPEPQPEPALGPLLAVEAEPEESILPDLSPIELDLDEPELREAGPLPPTGRPQPRP